MNFEDALIGSKPEQSFLRELDQDDEASVNTE
jgi:hypothetical protein